MNNQTPPTADLESSLKAFVRWSLDKSYSNRQLNANLQILNCAWTTLTTRSCNHLTLMKNQLQV